MGFILVHFDEISRTAGFEEMGRINVDLGESWSLFLLLLFVQSCSASAVCICF